MITGRPGTWQFFSNHSCVISDRLTRGIGTVWLSYLISSSRILLSQYLNLSHSVSTFKSLRSPFLHRRTSTSVRRCEKGNGCLLAVGTPSAAGTRVGGSCAE